MNSRIIKQCLVTGIFSVVSFVSAFAEVGPKAAVQNTVEQIVKAVEANPGDAKMSERRVRLREIINPQFDFAKMAQLSMGASWPTINPDQQKEFVDVFSNLLSKTYMTKIETVKPGMVTIETESIDPTGTKATVKTLVKSKGDVFPIDYKLLKVGEEWKVYDVVIENIGLVVNYRNEFAGIIRKEKFEGLMQKLREKTA